MQKRDFRVKYNVRPIESEGDHWYGIITGQEKPISKKKKDKHERQFYRTYYKEHKKNMQLDNYTDLVGCFNVNMQIEGDVKITCPLRSAFIYNMNSSDHKHPHSIIPSYI